MTGRARANPTMTSGSPRTRIHGFHVLAALAALLVSLAAAAGPYKAGWYGQAQATASHVENINGSYYDKDAFSDQRVYLQIGAGHLSKFGNRSQLTMSGYLGATVHGDYQEVDNLVVSATAEFSHALGNHWRSPWLSLRTELARIEYRDSRGREGLLWQSEAALNRRLTPTLTGHLGLRRREMLFPGRSDVDQARFAGHEWQRNALWAGLDVELRRNVFVYLEYEFSTGKFTSNAWDTPGMVPPYEARSPDPAYRPCSDDSCPVRWAYLVDSDIQRGEIGVVWHRNQLILDLSAGLLRGSASGFPDYEAGAVTLGVSRFF